MKDILDISHGATGTVSKIKPNALEKIKAYKRVGMCLTPAHYSPGDKNKDKNPVPKWNGKYKKDGKKDWKWAFDWTDDELANAIETKRLAVYHNPKKYEAKGDRFFDAESDDKLFCINNYFMNCFPPTFTIGKSFNGLVNVPTHLIYKCPKDVKPKQYAYDDKNNGRMVELLTSGVSVIDGLDRLILREIEPVEADPKEITLRLKLATFFAELEPHWPKEEGRNSAHFLLAGAFAKETDVPLEMVREFVIKFCDLTDDDDDELDNRLDCYERQYEAFEKGEELTGIASLAMDQLVGGTKLNPVIFNSFDELKRIDKEEEEERIPYPIITSREFTFLDFPTVDYIMDPLFTNKSTNQIVGPSGVGKTIFGMSIAIHMSSGLDFLHYKCNQKTTCAYIEGELPGADILSRRDSISSNLYDTNKIIDPDNLFILSKDNLEMAGFKYGFNMIAVSRNMSDTEAKDYGRRGREFIDDYLYGIEKKTGNKPFLFLDNITALADIDENRSTDWTPIIHWLTRNKTKGYSSCFFHHANKDGKSSGSSSKERLLDTTILLEELGADTTFNMPGDKNMECRVTFDKARNFGGSKNSKAYLLTMDQNGVWTKYPDLKQQDFILIDLWKKDGIRTVDELAKCKEITLAKGTLYTHIKTLKDMKLMSNKDPMPTKETEDF